MKIKTLIQTRTATAQNGDALALAYYLTETQSGFGVAVECRRNEIQELAQIPDISPDQQRVCQLIDRLADGLVTPTTLNDVVQDWL